MRVTVPNNDGGYTCELSRDELIKILGKYEDQNLVPTWEKGDPVWFFIHRGQEGPIALKGVVKRVYKSHKQINGCKIESNKTIYDWVPLNHMFINQELFQKGLAAYIAEIEKGKRYSDFYTRVRAAYYSATLSLNFPQNVEERIWFDEWLKHWKTYEENLVHDRIADLQHHIAWANKLLQDESKYDYEPKTCVRALGSLTDDNVPHLNYMSAKSVLTAYNHFAPQIGRAPLYENITEFGEKEITALRAKYNI